MSKDNKTFWLSVMAIMVSSLALIVSYYETSILKQQQKLLVSEQAASVWPYLEVNTSMITSAEDMSVQIILKSKGVGPALVQSTDLRMYGQSINSYSDIVDLLQQDSMVKAFTKLSLHLDYNSVLSPGESISILELVVIPDGQDSYSFYPETASCYCSIYNQCWEVSSEDSDPQPTNSCP